MTLAEYLDLPGKTATDLAREVGCSVSTITRAAKREIVPRPKTMERIYKSTGGLVPPDSFYSLAA